MQSTVPASLINDTLSVITDTCAVDIINCLSPGRVRWAPVVTQQAGNRAGISVCLLPKPLVPPHTHTVLKTPMQFLLLLTQRLPLAVDTMDVDFCFYSLSVLNPERETALESRTVIDKGHVSLISERMGSLEEWKPRQNPQVRQDICLQQYSGYKQSSCQALLAAVCASIANLFF